MEQPRSPESSTVKLRDCIEELMKFILQSHLDRTLDLDLNLSEDFCSHLVNDDLKFTHPNLDITDFMQENPQICLYKHLALALCGCINGKLELFDGFSDLKEKEEWNKIVTCYGNELVNILKRVNFQLHVQEPFFTQLKDGAKTVEGRCAVGDYNLIGPGALILFNKCLVLEVQAIHRYSSFSEMLEAEGIVKVLPGVESIEEGVEIYRKFYTEEKEKLNGVLAIWVAKSVVQPYTPLARILSGLSYEGIHCFLAYNTQQKQLQSHFNIQNDLL